MPVHHQSRFKKGLPRSGFTLIELLVVISIIAILAAMLLPAIGMVKANANASKCLSSQRQVALGCIAYTNDNDGMIPALYLKSTPIATFWSNLILVDYLEARKDTDGTHTNFSGTVIQGCSEWNRATAGSTNRIWQSAYAMNARPFCEGNVIDLRSSNYVTDAANARGITLSQITKQSSRLFFGDALNGPASGASGTSTYLLSPVNTVVTEASNITNLKSWHTLGNNVTVTMFDGHGEKRNVTTAASAMSNP